MKLTLLADNDKGNPLGSAEIPDGDDGSSLSDALGEIEEQATEILKANAEAAAAKQAQLATPLEEEPAPAATASKTTTTASKT